MYVSLALGFLPCSIVLFVYFYDTPILLYDYYSFEMYMD